MFLFSLLHYTGAAWHRVPTLVIVDGTFIFGVAKCIFVYLLPDKQFCTTPLPAYFAEIKKEITSIISGLFKLETHPMCQK